MRKIYLINKPFQLRFIGFICVVNVLTVTVFYVSNLLFFRTFTEMGRSFGLPADHAFYVFISQQQSIMNKIFLISGILFTLLLFVFGIYYSHRIAGSLYRLNKHLLSLSESLSLEDLKFRKNDFFQEIPDSFNQFLKKLRENFVKKESN